MTFKARGERFDGGGRRRGHTSQQRQRGVPDEPGIGIRSAPLDRLGHFAAVALNRIEEAAPATREAVGQLGLHAPREAVSVLGFRLPLDDVFTPTLYEVPRQLPAQRIISRGAMLQRQEFWVEE